MYNDSENLRQLTHVKVTRSSGSAPAAAAAAAADNNNNLTSLSLILMTSNANADLSTTMSPAGAVSEDLPVARVSRDPVGFKVQFGDDEIIGAPGDDLPFPVENAKQETPRFKKYGALFGCDGGKLTIGETTYRIRKIDQQQQANGMECFQICFRSFIVEFIQVVLG